MKTRKILSLLLALALLAAAALTAQAETLTDMAGRELVLDAPLTRAIALNPADCESSTPWARRMSSSAGRILQLSRGCAVASKRQQRRTDQY